MGEKKKGKKDGEWVSSTVALVVDGLSPSLPTLVEK